MSAFHGPQLLDGTVKLYDTPVLAFAALMDTLKRKSSMAIQDDYDFWHSHDYKRHASKILMVNHKDFDTHHIFFDDNLLKNSVVNIYELDMN